MAVTDLEIIQLVGRSAFEKGQAYQRQGRVRAIVRDEDTIFANVRGSGGNLYKTSVEVRRGANNRLIAAGTCSCPVGENCKHVAATILEAEKRPLVSDTREAANPGRAADLKRQVGNVAKAPASRSISAAPNSDRGSKSVLRPTQMQAPTPVVLPLHILDWIERLGTPELGDEYPPDIAQRLIYVLEPHAYSDETPTLSVSL